MAKVRKEKVLRVTMPDGSKWDVNARFIARNRGNYYADKDAAKDTPAWRKAYQREFYLTLDDDDELVDWAANNMNWSDVSDNAVEVREPNPPTVDYQEGWVNGEKEIISD